MSRSTPTSPRSPHPPGSRVQVTPTYSLLSEKLRRISAGSLQCSLFCGGRGCKWEGAGHWAESEQAVRGLFSHWVTPSILAMSRPNTRLLRQGTLLEDFKRHNICSVINLQLPGEHGQCGPGLESTSGFTYCPEDFMNNGVYFYNYGWVDYGVPTLPSLLDMVKVMDFALSEGKVAVHCHAGLGRTGVLIACYLAYAHRLTGPDAVATVREKRPGAVQSRSQVRIVLDFASFLTPLWTFFPSSPTPSSSPTFSPTSSPSLVPDPYGLGVDELVHNQTLILHGQQEMANKDIPKVVEEMCRILHAHQSCDSSIIETWAVGGAPSDHTLNSMQSIKEEMNSCLDWRLLHSEPSPAPLLHLLSSFLHSLKAPLLESSVDPVWLFTSHHPTKDTLLSKARRSTALKIITTLGVLLQKATQEAAPTDPTTGIVAMATEEDVTPMLHECVAKKVVADMTQQISQPSSSSKDHHQAMVTMVTGHWKQLYRQKL